MKKISIMVPCYNEEENVEPLSKAIIEMFAKDLPQYDYEIVFNGEIYNYQDIKDELIKFGYKFNTNSDTEVLLIGL